MIDINTDKMSYEDYRKYLKVISGVSTADELMTGEIPYENIGEENDEWVKEFKDKNSGPIFVDRQGNIFERQTGKCLYQADYLYNRVLREYEKFKEILCQTKGKK